MKTHVWMLVLFLLAGAVGCSGPITLKGRAPSTASNLVAEKGVGAVTVTIDDNVPADRRRLLDKCDLANAMQRAVSESFRGAGLQRAGGMAIAIRIHQFLASDWGAGTRLGARVTLTRPNGEVLREFEKQAYSTRGGFSKSSRIKRVAQDLVYRILDGI